MNSGKKTIFITGGGTGGHIYPAVAVYKELRAQGHNLYYIGNKNKLEYSICSQEGFNFLSVNVDGMPRKLSLKFIFWIFKRKCFFRKKRRRIIVSFFICLFFSVFYFFLLLFINQGVFHLYFLLCLFLGFLLMYHFLHNKM